MELLGSNVVNQVGLRLLLCPLGSNVVVRTACCSVGTVLPVYSTIKALERKDVNEQKRWLLYWADPNITLRVFNILPMLAVYGSFSVVEVFSDKLLSWVPMYYHLKFAFLVWLQLPTLDGAKTLYSNHLRPFFLRHQARVDQVVGLAYGEMGKIMSSHEEEIKFVRIMLVKIMASVDQTVRGAGPDQPRGQTINENIATRVSDAESDLTLSDVSSDEPQGESTVDAPT